jgi:xanthine dehydrogenase accessory factor
METLSPKPQRTAWSEDDTDILALIQSGQSAGLGAVLITIVGIEGGSPRGLGAQMAVLSDGRYTGYVSGGCADAAVAAEALKLYSEGHNNTVLSDAVLRFGAGSRYMDIQLPCGGAIDLHFCFNPHANVITDMIARRARRECFALQLAPFSIVTNSGLGAGTVSGWHDTVFRRVYPPPVHLLLCGNGIEMTVMAKTAIANGYSAHAIVPDKELAAYLTHLDIPVTTLKSLSSAISLAADAQTAIIFLFHDFDWEMKLLPAALSTNAFYIGALGSPKTHAARLKGLQAIGVADEVAARIKGPLGIVPATRNAADLAISVLAEVALYNMHKECAG